MSSRAPPVDTHPVHIRAIACATALGDTGATLAALLRNTSALRFMPVLGEDGGEPVPLALRAPMRVTAPPRWWDDLLAFLAPLAGSGWGGARRPICISSSNYGIDGLYGLGKHRQQVYADWATPHTCAAGLRAALGWGENLLLLSHACVSAQLALLQAARWLHADVADEALVLSFDFIGPFVTAGFHSLKILNDQMPAPYQVGETGSIGLGDGMAYAVLSRHGDGPVINAQVLYNEMFHFTANNPDGSGFHQTLNALRAAIPTPRFWVKGHGTGTLEAGRLEAEAVRDLLPGQPLVAWKGALGHTLGSCALVELAIAIAAMREGRIPATVGSTGPCFSPAVMTEPFAAAGFDGALLLSNAFGGAHAAMFLTHA
jgi:hypothetical protein